MIVEVNPLRWFKPKGSSPVAKSAYSSAASLATASMRALAAARLQTVATTESVAEQSGSAKAVETTMSVETTLANVANDVKGFFAKLSADYQKAKQAWTLISSPQVRSVVITISSDAVKLVKDGVVAAGATGLSMPLDAAVVADIKQLVADAKAGDGVIVADLKVLGITL